jgi:hypothetical protein
MGNRRVIVNIYSNLNPLDRGGNPQCISVHGIQRSIKSTLLARTANEKNACVLCVVEEISRRDKVVCSLMKVV